MHLLVMYTLLLFPRGFRRTTFKPNVFSAASSSGLSDLMAMCLTCILSGILSSLRPEWHANILSANRCQGE